MKLKILALIVFAAAVGPLHALAQETGEFDPIESNLFAPELVMQHRAQLSLTDAQRRSITEAIRTLQNRVLDLEWDMQDGARNLDSILKAPSVDQGQALEVFRGMIEIEDQVKLAHFTALVTIRNALTPEQRDILTQLKQQ